MRPIGHTVVSSASGGAVYLATDSPMAGAVSLGVGVLLDLEHLDDYHQCYMKGREKGALYLAARVGIFGTWNSGVGFDYVPSPIGGFCSRALVPCLGRPPAQPVGWLRLRSAPAIATGDRTRPE